LRVGAVSVRAVRGSAADPTAPPRVAYAIGKRTGSAVVRNRIRRRLRAAVALHEAELTAGGAYLLSADRSAMSTPFAELADHVGRALRRAREELA
jgi:ribonuclease P protein component